MLDDAPKYDTEKFKNSVEIIRYADDFVLLSHDKEYLINILGAAFVVTTISLAIAIAVKMERVIKMQSEIDNLKNKILSYFPNADIEFIKKAFIEPGFSDDCEDDPFKISDAKTMLDYIQSIHT